MNAPSPESQTILESLRRAVADALERKRRLGQYAVVWKDGRPQTLQPETASPSTLQEAEPDSYAPRKTQD